MPKESVFISTLQLSCPVTCGLWWDEDECKTEGVRLDGSVLEKGDRKRVSNLSTEKQMPISLPPIRTKGLMPW